MISTQNWRRRHCGTKDVERSPPKIYVAGRKVEWDKRSDDEWQSTDTRSNREGKTQSLYEVIKNGDAGILIIRASTWNPFSWSSTVDVVLRWTHRCCICTYRINQWRSNVMSRNSSSWSVLKQIRDHSLKQVGLEYVTDAHMSKVKDARFDDWNRK